jgi:hypothetical protein
MGYNILKLLSFAHPAEINPEGTKRNIDYHNLFGPAKVNIQIIIVFPI